MTAPFSKGQAVIIVTPDKVEGGTGWVQELVGLRGVVTGLNWDMVNAPGEDAWKIGRAKVRKYRSVSIDLDRGDHVCLWLEWVQDLAAYKAAKGLAACWNCGHLAPAGTIGCVNCGCLECGKVKAHCVCHLYEGKTFLTVDAVNVGDVVRVIGTTQEGPVVQKYTQKIAVDCGGRVAEVYPAEVELVPQEAPAEIPALPFTRPCGYCGGQHNINACPQSFPSVRDEAPAAPALPAGHCPDCGWADCGYNGSGQCGYQGHGPLTFVDVTCPKCGGSGKVPHGFQGRDIACSWCWGEGAVKLAGQVDGIPYALNLAKGPAGQTVYALVNTADFYGSGTYTDPQEALAALARIQSWPTWAGRNAVPTSPDAPDGEMDLVAAVEQAQDEVRATEGPADQAPVPDRVDGAHSYYDGPERRAAVLRGLHCGRPDGFGLVDYYERAGNGWTRVKKGREVLETAHRLAWEWAKTPAWAWAKAPEPAQGVVVKGQRFQDGDVVELTGDLAVKNGAEVLDRPVVVTVHHVYTDGTATATVERPTVYGRTSNYHANFPLDRLVAAPAPDATAAPALKVGDRVKVLADVWGFGDIIGQAGIVTCDDPRYLYRGDVRVKLDNGQATLDFLANELAPAPTDPGLPGQCPRCLKYGQGLTPAGLCRDCLDPHTIVTVQADPVDYRDQVEPDEDYPFGRGTLGGVLAQARGLKEWSLDAAAAASGVNRLAIRRMERGYTQSPAFRDVAKLAQVYGLDLKDLARLG